MLKFIKGDKKLLAVAVGTIKYNKNAQDKEEFRDGIYHFTKGRKRSDHQTWTLK